MIDSCSPLASYLLLLALKLLQLYLNHHSLHSLGWLWHNVSIDCRAINGQANPVSFPLPLDLDVIPDPTEESRDGESAP